MAVRTAWLAAVACALSLPGCSFDKRPVLRVADWGGADEGDVSGGEQDVFDEFQKLHPEVELQRESIPGSQDYVRKVLMSFVASSEPDVIRLDASSEAAFIDNGAVSDLQPLVDGPNGIRLDYYFGNVVDIARRGKRLYAIPVDFTPLVVYYNKRLFENAHVPFPKDGWTWNDFVADAKTLTRGNQYGFTFTNWMAGWLPLFWNNGADVFGPNGKAAGSADAKPFVDSASFLRDLVDKDRVAPSLSKMAAEGAEPFLNGTAAMEVSGHWFLSSVAHAPKVALDDIGVVTLPVSTAGRAPVTVMYESGWAIGHNSRHKDLAWEFIKFYTGKKSLRAVEATGIGVPARKDIAAERATTPLEKEFLKIIPSCRQPWGTRVEGYDFVESEGQKAMDAILKSGRDPRSALHAFAVDVDRQLGKK